MLKLNADERIFKRITESSEFYFIPEEYAPNRFPEDETPIPVVRSSLSSALDLSFFWSNPKEILKEDIEWMKRCEEERSQEVSLMKAVSPSKVSKVLIPSPPINMSH